MHTYNHITCAFLYSLLVYSQHNVNEGECLCAAAIQLLSGMLTAATWWTAKQSGSRGSEAWSGLYGGEWEANWFRCWGITSQVQWKHVELSSGWKSHWWWKKSVTHTNTHASGYTCHVWCKSWGKFDLFLLGNNSIPALLLFFFRKKKKAPLRTFFSRTRSKRTQLVASGSVALF